MLQARNVNQFYGESHILWDASFELQPGTTTCLMGRNGVGKTTLLKVLMGLLPARSGTLGFDGTEILGRPAELRARLGIGYVPQGREIFPQLTVEENLRVGLAARDAGGRGGKKKGGIPDRIFALFPVLKQMLHRRGGDLSGGQQQQLAIGRALVLEPKILILDEPTEGIQPNVVSEIGDVLLNLNQSEKLTLLLVEQKLPFARRVGQHFVLMDRGRTVTGGKMADLTEQLVQRHLVV
jgi:urea transport system ATP-binding protein